MNDLKTANSPDVPITLEVLIDKRRAQLLWSNAAPVAGFEMVDRFEFVDSDDRFDLHEVGDWGAGTVMWCEGVVEALTLAAYETRNGFTSHVLWDTCSGPEWPGGHAVLTSRPYGV